MRSFRGFEAVVSPENLWQAWRSFERGKRRRRDVAAWGIDAERGVLRLSRELAEGRWRPGRYRLIRVRDPKRRVVAAAPVRDRVVHHALHQILAPWWNRRFIHHSYACLPGRGSHRALLCFFRRARSHRYVLSLDIARYFYSIDRSILKNLLFPAFPEPPLRALLQRVLDSGADLYQQPDVAQWLGWTEVGELGRGLPIGNLTSQWWGNVYLDGLDQYICRVLGHGTTQRYMDDITLFGNDPSELLCHRDTIAAWLHKNRGLRLKDPDAQPQSTYGSVT
ncbi:MAG TPA: reverse transcriptase domain-containing protein, partial [Myxococcota bacterium]|nr:reverse transcriptase domain-containing protein [Myxococcota bacterium]